MYKNFYAFVNIKINSSIILQKNKIKMRELIKKRI